MRIPLGKQWYQSRSIPVAAQRCVNFYYEKPPAESKTPEMLIGSPGMNLFTEVGDGPIWGMYAFGGLGYVVSGSNVYTVNSEGGVTDLGSIGTVSNAVIMDDNSVNVIINKQEGDSWLATSSSLVQITDAQYEDSSSVTVLNFYAIFPKIDSYQYYISDLLDAASYSGRFASAEQSSDNIVRAYATSGELWLFKEYTTEIHVPREGGGFPFRVLDNSTIQRGCAAKRSVAQEDNTLFWLGEDLIVYRADGYRPKRISTHGIEKIIGDMTTVSDCESFVYTQEGHKFLIMTFPTELVTLCYDIATGLWSQRQSFQKERWRASQHMFIFGKNLVGDFENGNIYELDLNTYTENGNLIQRITTLPVISKDKERMTHWNIVADFDTGVGLLSGQGSDPQAMMRFSDDGGYTWSNERHRPLGKTGKYKDRCIFRKCGRSRERVYEFSYTEPTKCNFTGVFLNSEDA